jgi:hypothetical protein
MEGLAYSAGLLFLATCWVVRCGFRSTGFNGLDPLRLNFRALSSGWHLASRALDSGLLARCCVVGLSVEPAAMQVAVATAKVVQQKCLKSFFAGYGRL